MANVLANLARVRSATTGTGSLALGAAVTGALTFTQAGVSDGSAVTYAIEDYDNNNLVTAREIGRGTFSGSTLTRDTVYSSTNAGSKINCSGRQHVFITAAKEDFDSFLTAAAASSAYQPLDADLTTLAASITTFGHSLVDDADAATARSTLGLGTMATETAANYYTAAAADAAFLSPAEGDAAYQPLDGELTAIAGLTSAADRVPYFTGSGTAALATFTTAGRNLVDDADSSAQRTTLGLGTGDSPQFTAINLGHASDTTLTRVSAGLMAVEGNTVAMLNTGNVFTQNQIIQKTNTNFRQTATSGQAAHLIDATSGNAAISQYGNWSGSAHQDRWVFGKDASAESGSDAGSQFTINYYGDSGVFKGTLLSASRVDGSSNFRKGVYSGGATGGSKGNDTLNFVTIYENGTSLASKYGALASANVWIAAQTVRIDNATTNAVTVGATLSHTTTGTPANGIGVSLAFEAETTAGNNEVGATIEAVVTDVTSTSEDFDLVFKTMAAGAAAAERMRIKSTNSIICGTAALATNATDGFLYVPSCAGTPTGAPTAQTGMIPIVVDSTNHKLYFYSGGAWRDAGP